MAQQLLLATSSSILALEAACSDPNAEDRFDARVNLVEKGALKKQ
jgi:hypothetical protein